MHLEIITPDTTIFIGEVELIQLPGIDGSFEILNNHAPFISALKEGKVKIKNNGKEDFFPIGGGVIEVANNKVLVLAE